MSFFRFEKFKKLYKESEKLSEKELFFRRDTKQDIYGLIIIRIICLVGSLIICILKF